MRTEVAPIWCFHESRKSPSGMDTVRVFDGSITKKHFTHGTGDVRGYRKEKTVGTTGSTG